MQTVDAAAEALEKEDMKMGYRDDKAIKAVWQRTALIITSNLMRLLQAEQRLEQAQEKGKVAEKEYVDAVNLANQLARDVYQSHLPPLLDARCHTLTSRALTLCLGIATY